MHVAVFYLNRKNKCVTNGIRARFIDYVDWPTW